MWLEYIVCTCVAGKAGVCSHVIGLLKQIIHYVMMKLKSVPEDLRILHTNATVWHKPHIEPEPVMNATFCKAKQCQMDIKKNPAICTLYEARSYALQNYSCEQQMNLKESLVQCKPTCGFADSSRKCHSKCDSDSFGAAPKGSFLSYQSLEYEKLDDRNKQSTLTELSCLPLGVLDYTPCVYEISNDQE